MSADDAYSVLGIVKKDGKPVEESLIRRSYFSLAQKYHPDKNPDGRDMFEKVNKAYEFLCSRTGKVTDGPDPSNLLLILKTQVILFSRYSAGKFQSFSAIRFFKNNSGEILQWHDPYFDRLIARLLGCLLDGLNLIIDY